MAGPTTTTLSSPSPPSEEPGTKLLETERLIIRRYVLSDAVAMAKAANNTAIAANMRAGFPSPYSLSDAEHFLTNMACKGDGTSYPQHNGIFLKPNTSENPSSEAVLIGACGIMTKGDIYYRTWELGYWLAQPAWGKGYATEAMRPFVRWCFETWPDLNRIEALVKGKNVASQKVLSKVGFVKEGNRREAMEKWGEIFDEVQFGLLRSDLQ
ncbi:hypothetical protein ACHAPJ_000664 [Fusarium lateritium]